MAGIKISQLPSGGTLAGTDEIPIARGSAVTYKVNASQIVIAASNVGSGAGQIVSGISGPTLQFRTLSADGDGIRVSTDSTNSTVVISTSGQNPTKTSFTGNGTTTSYAVTNAVSVNPCNYRVDIDGVVQEPLVDYTISGSNINFTTAPPNGSKVVVITNNLVRAYDVVPSDGTVTAVKLASNVGANAWRFVTTTFSIAAGDRIGADTSSTAYTGTLPASPSAGDLVTIVDTGGNWATNNLTIGRNGNTIQSLSEDLTLDVSNKTVILLYTGSTWVVQT